MEYIESISKDIDVEQINSLRASVGWPKKRSDEKWKEILSKSSFVYTLWDGDKLIGMGRILEDGITCLLCDGVVHKDYQSQGLGRIIMEKLLEQAKSKDYDSIRLFMDPNNINFLKPVYEKIGFEAVDTAMQYNKHANRH